MVTRKLNIRDDQEALLLLGERDFFLRQIEREHAVEVFVRHDPQGEELHLTLRGTASRVQKAIKRFRDRLDRVRSGETPDEPPHAFAFPAEEAMPPSDAVYMTAYGKSVRTRGERQKLYVDCILKGDLTFGIGPAGTGKTYLAVICALRALKAREVSRIVLTRPVVEAGEHLGFLPGDFQEKVNPYLKPLYDAFYAALGPDKFRIWRDDEIIEIVPLAYMRGRTLENAFIILDEAQNTTIEQMKMFLTRMGNGSRVVVTGDVTQIDLDSPRRSGLVVIEKILKHIKPVRFVHFLSADVVRHLLVKDIVEAFDSHEKEKRP
ncbi:MAG: phosphate starvation-inducible protein family [Elusimicrobia bacterium]|nr:MAG: phosphate starvation-inducible protein family [Elusimicrobiota bacterium]